MESTSGHHIPSNVFGTHPWSSTPPGILVCLDCSELSKTILCYAVMLSRAIGGSITLMHVVEYSCDFNMNSHSHDVLVWELKQREARQYMEQMLKDISPFDISAQIQIEEGRAAEQILGFLRNNPIDFVILASHGAHGLTEWNISSTASKIIGHTHCSSVIVPATPVYQQAGLQTCIKRILVPLDGSPASEASLPIAMRIARQQDAELVLVHAIEPTSFIENSGVSHADRETINNAFKILASAARDHLNRIAKRIVNEGHEVTVVVRPSTNPIALVSEIITSMNIDLLIMSAHGATRNEKYPLARTAEYMAAHTPIPLIIIQDLEKEQICKALEKHRYDRAPLKYRKSAGDDIG